jgi:hypothetical protein
MRSRIELAWLATCAAGLLAAAGLGAPARAALPGATGAAHAAGSVPDDVAVQQAITAVRKDPLMGGLHTVKTLHWLDKQHDKERSAPQPWLQRLLEWIAAFARWLAGSARALVIVAATIGVALLAIVIVRALRRSAAHELRGEHAPPTHVRGLNIQPEELPDDVARAARSVWARGDRRGAMVLLYRALLSRLVHNYRVAIRDSSTEGDCQRLAAQVLASAPRDYVARFIASWQRAMYATVWPGEADFEQLCAGFEQALPMPASPGAAGTATTPAGPRT